MLVGSRGLGGAKAVLGSVSDMVVHYASRPVLVVPHPLQVAEQAAVANGPIIVGWDGTAGAEAALAAAVRLFPTRTVQLASVNLDPRHPPATGGYEVISLASEGRHRAARATADALVVHAPRSQAALVVVGSRGRSAPREILLGNVAAATLHHAHRPIMVVPHAASPEES